MTRDEAAVSFAKMREVDRIVSVEPSDVALSTVPVKETTRYTGLPGTFTAYKVVQRLGDEEGVWRSATAGDAAQVVYRVGEPAQAPPWLAVLGYFLTVFDTLESAARHWQSLGLPGQYAVFEVEALYAEPLPPRAAPWSLSTRKPALTLFPEGCRHWPFGTVMAQRLTGW